jgi:hypothetical protein
MDPDFGPGLMMDMPYHPYTQPTPTAAAPPATAVAASKSALSRRRACVPWQAARIAVVPSVRELERVFDEVFSGVAPSVEAMSPACRRVLLLRGGGWVADMFARALKAALREDPDVIVIGEMRDHETISLAISAAETGHLVMGSLHTGGAIRTISRVLGVFPPAQQSQVRSMVSESLRAVISQRLVARADGKGRVAALEILHVNQAVANTMPCSGPPDCTHASIEVTFIGAKFAVNGRAI